MGTLGDRFGNTCGSLSNAVGYPRCGCGRKAWLWEYGWGSRTVDCSGGSTKQSSCPRRPENSEPRARQERTERPYDWVHTLGGVRHYLWHGDYAPLHGPRDFVSLSLAIEDAHRLCLLLFVEDYLDALLTVYAKRVSAEMAPDHGDIGHEQDWAAIEDQLKRAMTNILRSSWMARDTLRSIEGKIAKRIEHDRSSGDLSGVERNKRILKFIDEI